MKNSNFRKNNQSIQSTSLITYSLFLLLLLLLLLQVPLQPVEASSLLKNSKALDELTSSTENEITKQQSNHLNDEQHQKSNSKQVQDEPQVVSNGFTSDKKMFVTELLKMLHEQYSIKGTPAADGPSKKLDTTLGGVSSASNRQLILTQLMNAISADGDIRRLVDWIQNSFNLASVSELTTQFVVSKLGSVNCAALLKPDAEETLTPRFLLFNEHFTDVPFELPISPTATDCIANGHFDPQRKTILLIHGFLAGYTLVDGLTNIKNRLLDLNRVVNEQSLYAFTNASRNNGSYVLTEDIERKVRSQQHNVIIIDWFRGANPFPRARYIRAAVNAQVVGELIARFLSSLVTQCKTPASSIEMIAHSLGCHVAGFTGKAMLARGQQVGQITHLDPVGLCFGRLFSQPKFRLRPNDAIYTQAVHVSLNLFDNPLDGVHSNFMVNGGRDQVGCGGELKNSTSSSVALLYDPHGKFSPCSHVRALALFEDDLSSQPGQCQIVGYKCPSYDLFLAGKCGKCDAMNRECRLMSLPPIIAQFRRLSTLNPTRIAPRVPEASGHPPPALQNLVSRYSNGSIAWLIHDKEINQKIVKALGSKLEPDPAPKEPMKRLDVDLVARAGRTTTSAGERLVRTLDKIRIDTVNAFAGGLSNFMSAEYKLSSFINPAVLQFIDSPKEGILTGHTDNDVATKSGSDHTEQSDGSKDIYELPIGSQPIPSGSQNGPLYFVGTGPVSTYCVNYYQFRVLIAESRLKRLLETGVLKKQTSMNSWGSPTLVGAHSIEREAAAPKESLHMTIKLTDSKGRFFKGFTLQEGARALAYAPRTESLLAPRKAHGEPMVEFTMLLNTTRPEPVKISETIISYYFHPIVLADLVELNYMSNISPE